MLFLASFKYKNNQLTGQTRLYNLLDSSRVECIIHAAFKLFGSWPLIFPFRNPKDK